MREIALRHDEMHETRHERQQEDSIRRAREVRTRTPGCVLLLALLSMFVLFVSSETAYAATIDAEIISGPVEVPAVEMYGASIAAPDRYTAAALLMGYGPDAVAGWDDDVKAKLSNSDTGGYFYVFATESVQSYFDVTQNTGVFQDYLNAVGGTFWNIAQSLYGNNLWVAMYTSGELALAKADLERVLSGEDIGGGSTQDGEYFVYDFKSDDLAFSGVTSVYVPKSIFSFHSERLNADTIKSGAVEFLSGSGGVFMGRIWFLSNSENPEIYPNPDRNLYTSIIVTNATYWNQTSVVEFTPEIQGSAMYLTSTQVINIYDSSVREGNYTCNLIIGSQTVANAVFSGQVGGGGGGDPVIPPTNWPEPEPPEPPELPEPGTNPTVTPTPWSPVISPTFDFDLNITTEPTSNDLIDWVKKIYFELRSFHSDEQDWFDEVGKGIDGLVDAIDDAQEQIYGELQTVDETLRSEGQKIRDYMYRMFHWLKDQLNFQNDSFNDSNIVYWLKRIWSKLGNGDINLRPTDPTNDPDDWWDWLVKAIQNFLIGLAATSTELISEIADLASQVMHEFPFSIPWDIAAVLAALSTAPITPVFTITIPAVDGWWASFDFVIDLSPFDGAAETIRLMEKLLFTGLLIWKSKELLDFMDVTKWFN